MSLFGSREDDPLLQDDPLAPSEEASQPRDDASSRSGADGPDAARADDGPAPSRPDEAPAAGADDGRGLNGEAARRALVRSVDDAERGDLSVLNTAFDQGWRLEGVVYREETADLLFLLQQQDPSAEQNGLIV